MLPMWIRLYRLVFGALAVVAVFNSYNVFNDEYFWHFFTYQSSILAGVVLLLGATLCARRHSPLAWDIARGTAVMVMVTTGLVYAVLLDGLYNPFDGSHIWPSTFMHQLLPIVMVVDLLIVPLHRTVPMRTVAFFTVYPLAWLAFTIWYGNGSGWYPYDFLDPTGSGGATGVAVTVTMMMIGFLLIAAAIIRLGKVMRTGSGVEPLPERAG